MKGEVRKLTPDVVSQIPLKHRGAEGGTELLAPQSKYKFI